jgi:hypothetical protein
MEKCHQQHQEIKNEDMLEKVVGKFFSDREAQYCDAEIIFVTKLGRNLEDGTLFFWCANWSFDPGITSVMKATSKMVVIKDLYSFVLNYPTDLECGCWIFDPGIERGEREMGKKTKYKKRSESREITVLAFGLLLGFGLQL